MKPSEAIEILKNMKWSITTKFNAVNSSTKALDMAISALKFKENYDKFWEEVKSAGMRGEEVEIHHSGRVFRIREVVQ